MMVKFLLVLSIIFSVSHCASILALKKDGLDDGHFLNKPVDKPRIQEGSSGEIHRISDAKSVNSDLHKDEQLDSLLRNIYEKFVTVGEEANKDSSLAQHQVRFGQNGKAYPNMKNVPMKDKKDLSRTHFGEDGKARPVDSHIPLTHNDEEKVSMDDVLNSIKTLVDKLTAKKVEAKREETKEFTFKSVEDDKKKEVSNDNNIDAEYNAFKKKFFDAFDKSHNEKRQTLIGMGKDNHAESESLYSGSSGKPDYPTMIGSGKDDKRNKLRSRLNDLYDELRKETADRLDQERELNEKKRLDLVKKDLVDLLNGLQSKETFTFHDGKFGIDERIINSVEENTREVDTARAAETNNQEAKRSKLAVVQALVKQLRQLEDTKKREEMEKKEEEETKKSVERMENIFMGALKKELEKRKELTAAREKDAARMQEEKRRLAEEETARAEEKKREAEQEARELKLKADELQKRENDLNTGREMLLKIMADLEKRVAANEKSKVDTSTKNVKKSTNSNSMEKELDSIISSFSKRIQKKDTNENEIDKIFEGFNIDQNKVKGTRP